MSDLVVDYHSLEASHATAAALKWEFENLPHNERARAHTWGSGDIEDAMYEFANNWDYRRDILSGKLQDVGEKIESVLRAFREADAKLGHELERGMTGGDR